MTSDTSTSDTSTSDTSTSDTSTSDTSTGDTSTGEAVIRAWLAGALTNDWAGTDQQITIDRDEVVIVIDLATPDLAAVADAGMRRAAADGRITGFRSDTRDRRIEVATEAEQRFGRKVSWGARCGETSMLFTHIAVPAMTRLRQPERLVLDTLVNAGVARSRSEALAWCVRLVGQHTQVWLADLRTAMADVERIRDQGPQLA